jgi:hypothetical protein
MATALFLAVLFVSFLVGLGLRLRGMHWLRAWIAASLVIPVSMLIVDLLQPTGWLGVALFFGTLYGFGLGGLGVLIGWLATRGRRSDAAS